jgi:hypothetical protein
MGIVYSCDLGCLHTFNQVFIALDLDKNFHARRIPLAPA